LKQAAMVSPGNIEIHEIQIPVLKAGEVLVKIHRVGICGSDVHIRHGELPFVKYPIVQGHEACGVVAGTCECNNDIQVGDKVIIIPRIICGECYACKSGKTNFCEKLQIIGVHINGVCSEYVSIPERSVIKIPELIPFDIGAMIEPLAVAVHTLNMAGEVKDRNVLVIGAGVIGNLVAQAAKARGAKVMIVGRTQYRLDFAKQFGIDYCINEKNEDLGLAVSNRFGKGADICFECIGVDKSVNDCLAYCKKGGIVVIAGVFGEKQLIDLFALQDKELNVIGSMLYVEKDFQESITLIEQRKVQLEPLISAHYALEDFDGAYNYIADKSNPVMKVIIDIGD